MTPQTQPQRIQLSRRKGFNLQRASMELNGLPAVNCARPTIYGNPWSVAEAVASGLFSTDPKHRDDIAAQMVREYRLWLMSPNLESRKHRQIQRRRVLLLEELGSLRGKNLGCWCKPGKPCHCDVLLELANAK